MKRNPLVRASRMTLVACATGALIATMGVTPAIASENHNGAERIAALVADVAPTQGNVEQTSETAAAEFSSDIASLPSTDSAPIVIEGGDSPLEVRLPAETTTAAGVEAADGTVVYLSENGGVDVAAQVLDSDKVRVQTVIHDAGDAHEFTYEIGNGYAPVEAADGSLWAYKFDDKGEINIYGIGDAWARDADGAVVDTHYEIRGNSIVQVVNPAADAVYPLVADPTWEWYNAAYGAGFSKAETRNLANLGGVTGFCGALWAWPVLGAACAIAGAQWFTQAGLAVNAGGCVFIAAVPAPLAVRWLSSKCR